MDTRELFERLVADEPPLSIGAADMSARGLRKARRRREGFAAAGVTALVLVVVTATAQLAGPDQRRGGTLGPGGTQASRSLPFTSSSQTLASGEAVYARLLAAGPPGHLKEFPPTVVRAADKTPLLETAVAFAAGGTSLVLDATVASPKAAVLRYGAGFAAKQSCPQLPSEFSGQPVSCVSKLTLPGGAHVFAAESSPAPATGTPAGVTGRSVLFVAADGSTLEIVESAEVSSTDGTDVPLPATGALDASAMIALAEQSASAWSAAAGAPAVLPSPAAATQAIVSAAPSPSGPASLPFLSARQIAASNARVYGILVAYAGGAAVVTRGDPIWDTNPVTDATQFVGTQVQYRTRGGTGMLRVVTDTAADTRSRYSGLLSGDLCAELAGRSTDDGTLAGCRRVALAGGGTLWTYSRRESTPGEISNRDPSSTLGPAVYERDAIVVARDGSALELLFQVLGTVGGGPVPLPLTDGVMPDLASLGGLALDAAATWQPHDADLNAAASRS